MSLRHALLATNRDTRTEAKALGYAILPHSENDDSQKTITLGLVALWGAMTLLWQLGYPAPPEAWGMLTGFVAWRIGRIQEKEASRLEDSD